MTNLSRRKLARYGAEQLIENKSVRSVAKELAAILVQSRRANQAELLVFDINWELERRGMVANARVTTATALSEGLRKQIASHVKRAAKVERVALDERIDKSVIAGFRIDTAIHGWDKTLKHELTDIQEAF